MALFLTCTEHPIRAWVACEPSLEAGTPNRAFYIFSHQALAHSARPIARTVRSQWLIYLEHKLSYISPSSLMEHPLCFGPELQAASDSCTAGTFFPVVFEPVMGAYARFGVEGKKESWH